MWIQLSFIVFAIMALQDLLHRYFMYIGFTPIELVMYGLIPTVLFGLVYIWINKVPLTKPQPRHIALFIISGILSFYTFFWMRQAQILSPNIGYVSVIIYSSVLVTILLTAYLFKDKIHPRGVAGALLIVVGLGLITSIYTPKPSSRISIQ